MKENQRQRQKKETREKIVATAMTIFAEKGFLVPTTEIAKAAGISHGSVFVHFPTREALVDCAVSLFFDRLNQQMNDAVEGHACVEDLLQVFMSILGESEEFYCNLITQISLLPEETREKLFAYQTTVAFHFGKALKREKEDGRLIDLPYHMLLNMWLSLVHYYLQNRTMFAPDGSVIERCRDELITSYLTMIRRG